MIDKTTIPTMSTGHCPALTLSPSILIIKSSQYSIQSGAIHVSTDQDLQDPVSHFEFLVCPVSSRGHLFPPFPHRQSLKLGPKSCIEKGKVKKLGKLFVDRDGGNILLWTSFGHGLILDGKLGTQENVEPTFA